MCLHTLTQRGICTHKRAHIQNTKKWGYSDMVWCLRTWHMWGLGFKFQYNNSKRMNGKSLPSHLSNACKASYRNCIYIDKSPHSSRWGSQLPQGQALLLCAPAILQPFLLHQAKFLRESAASCSQLFPSHAPGCHLSLSCCFNILLPEASSLASVWQKSSTFLVPFHCFCFL